MTKLITKQQKKPTLYELVKKQLDGAQYKRKLYTETFNFYLKNLLGGWRKNHKTIIHPNFQYQQIMIAQLFSLDRIRGIYTWQQYEETVS